MPCLPLACWLIEQAGFVNTGLLTAYGALFSVHPGGIRCMRVGSMVPSPVGGGGYLDQAP